MKYLRALLIMTVSLGFVAVAPADVPVAEVAHLKGKAVRTSLDGISQALDAGASLYEGDTVATKRRSVITMRFKDQTSFSLGPKSSFSIDSYKYEQGSEDGIATRVIEGAFRFTTGLIAKLKPRSMRVQTGVVATIGIRGTTVGGEVEGESATVVLLEPEEEGTTSAIEVGNEHGSVVIEEPGYGTRVPDANSPPTPPERMRLRAMDNLIRSLQSIQRVPVPRPVY